LNKNEKWNEKLVNNINDDEWKIAYNICFYVVKDNYLSWLQFRILTRILGTKYKLHKLNITQNPLCPFCSANDETIMHLFCQCPFSNGLWHSAEQWIFNRTRLQITFDDKTKIFGYNYKNQNFTPINTILLVIKSYIFWCSRNNIIPNIINCQNRIERVYLDQLGISRKTLKVEQFERKWNTWINLFTFN